MPSNSRGGGTSLGTQFARALCLLAVIIYQVPNLFYLIQLSGASDKVLHEMIGADGNVKIDVNRGWYLSIFSWYDFVLSRNNHGIAVLTEANWMRPWNKELLLIERASPGMLDDTVVQFSQSVQSGLSVAEMTVTGPLSRWYVIKECSLHITAGKDLDVFSVISLQCS